MGIESGAFGYKYAKASAAEKFDFWNFEIAWCGNYTKLKIVDFFKSVLMPQLLSQSFSICPIIFYFKYLKRFKFFFS